MADVDRTSASGQFTYNAEALTFFKEIESNRAELLSFDGAAKWQMVQDRLLNAGLIEAE
jgi:hypothetical protein